MAEWSKGPIGGVGLRSSNDGEEEEIKKAMGFGETPEGGYSPGTRVEKSEFEVGDANPKGSRGTIKGGIKTSMFVNGHQCNYGYLVDWDIYSQMDTVEPLLAFVVDWKLKEI